MRLPQIPAYHKKLETLQGGMLELATRTASMRQRSGRLASQVRVRGLVRRLFRVVCSPQRPRHYAHDTMPTTHAQVADS